MTPSAPQIRVQDIDHCGIVAGIIENVPRGWGLVTGDWVLGTGDWEEETGTRILNF
ncbi:hypothetical protein QUB80_09050 [Chlorogloeopsis sp. ULAP01]|nr:hypothetical protein [Chlorogloeopsis sp. ULAP01]